MNSVDRVRSILKERGIAVSKLEKDLGYANGYVGQLRKGSFPAKRLSEIAKYLNVSTQYLLDGVEGEESISQSFSDDELRLIAMYRELSSQGKEYIFQQMTIASQVYQKNTCAADLESSAG